MSILENRVALVTGGGRGIGRAIAQALAQAGATVVITGRNQQALAETCAGYTNIQAITADLGIPNTAQQLVGQVQQQFGPVSILVNNAGITASLRLTDTDDATWQRIMDVNVTAPFACCRAVIPDMLHQGWGRIINIASIAGLNGLAYSSAYSASKHALIGLTRSIALELGNKGITANALCPGWVETDMLHDAINTIVAKTGRTAAEARASLLSLSHQQRVITPAEIADAAMRLVLPEGATTNGAAIVLA
jgi:NAD(P)-dependent dehydrogenase (short-subunit alcohol dehydrogenase family)